MIKSTYLWQNDYFADFKECAKYYHHEECNDLEELQDALKEEQQGMAYPILEEI